LRLELILTKQNAKNRGEGLTTGRKIAGLTTRRK
jgi:hypothetical protein